MQISIHETNQGMILIFNQEVKDDENLNEIIKNSTELLSIDIQRLYSLNFNPLIERIKRNNPKTVLESILTFKSYIITDDN